MLPGMRLWKKKRRWSLKIKKLEKKLKQLEGANTSSVNSKNNTSRSSSILFSNASTQTATTSEKSLSQVALNCLICGKLCEDSNHLKKHSEADHKLVREKRLAE